MGLLDDAIREHLELKRRRGADPGEIARAEHEALEPIFPEEEVSGDGSVPADEVSSLPGPAEVEVGGEDGAQLESAGYEEPVGESADFANVGQETAELDMQAVLEADGEYAPPQQAPAASACPVRAERDGIPEEVPGQERMSFE